MKTKIQTEVSNFKLLLRSVPATSMVFFVLSVTLMNILANKELVSTSWLSLDCGFLLSWISFLSMDMVVKRFGAKASIQLSLFAEGINLLFSALLFLVSLVPQNWGEFYATENPVVNASLNSTIGGTWYVVLGSTTAFLLSAIVNSLLNEYIGSKMKKDNFLSFSIRSYASTFIGQFIDNLVFAYIVSYHFFGWSTTQCLMCAVPGAVFDLIMEVIFIPIGYKSSKKWKEEGIGNEYLDIISKEL